ncbi:hypothetical protein SORBI_3010G148750 [Sorghum bicolor]|uniref:Uncharacterized protein n=1 Tax=Sorghum bicolor TaxID=4558 RepID=A0A1W0VT78_SORBI|nr:hypothetical protein SORBI_3010G148750 [Sorghum bicolor]
MRKFDKCTERPSMLSGLWLQFSGRESVDKQYWRNT